MIKTYKNDIYRIIKDEEYLDPTKFVLTDSLQDGCPISTLTIRDSKMNFIFRNTKNSWEDFDIRFNRFTPNFDLSVWFPSGVNSYYNYQSVATIFKNWLQKEAKKYFEEVENQNKWDEFQFETNIFELIQVEFNDNTNFNFEESSKILQALENLKTSLLDKFSPSVEQIEFINERLEYLANATNRLGKFDWTNTMVSVMISIAINMSFDTESGKVFFELIKQVFKSIQGLLL